MASPRPDQSILVLGCGFTGLVLAQRLAFKGRPVFGTTRSEAQANVIRTRGAEPVLWDASDLGPLDKLRGRVGAVVSLVPPTMTADGFDDPHARLLELFADQPLAAFVYVSSTSVWGDHGGAVVTEATPADPDSPRGEARLAIERQILASGLPAMVVRPSGIYGPGRSQLHRIARGDYKLVGDGQAISNRVHVRDLVAILEAAIERGTPGSVYLATDQRPASQREVVDHIVSTYGLPAPPAMSLDEARVRLSKDAFRMITGSKRLDPTATLDALRVRLRYPDYQSGLAAIWQQEAAELRGLPTR